MWAPDAEFAPRACAHPDCDGWRTAHAVEERRDEHGLVRFVCVECGPLHIGSYGPAAVASGRAQWGKHSSWVHCDGRCAAWTS